MHRLNPIQPCEPMNAESIFVTIILFIKLYFSCLKVHSNVVHNVRKTFLGVHIFTS